MLVGVGTPDHCSQPSSALSWHAGSTVFGLYCTSADFTLVWLICAPLYHLISFDLCCLWQIFMTDLSFLCIHCS
jgi:hypothetical protein